MSTETPDPIARRRTAIALLLGLLAAGRVAAQGTLSTDDGLSLTLSASGAVGSLGLGGSEYASSSLPSGFAFRELSATALDLAPAGSLEAESNGSTVWSWENNDSGTWTWDATVFASGSRSLRVDVPGTEDRRSPALLSTPFPIRPNTPYTISYHVRTENLSSVLNVFLVEMDTEGRIALRSLPSGSGTSDWQRRQMTFVSGASAVSGSFRVEIYSGHGTAWIDNVQMLDPFAGRAPTPFGGPVVAERGQLHQTSEAEGLKLEAAFSSVGSAIRVEADLVDTTGRDRGIELSFRLPIDASGWTWEKSPISSIPIADGVRYETLDSTFGAQSHSTYPFATIRSQTAAFSLATPMVPQMNRFQYVASDGFSVTWDVGLSASASKTPSRAHLVFWIYIQDPRWGMRAAAEKYRALNPFGFVSPVSVAKGSWVIPAGGSTISTVQGFEDFGWGFLEGVGDIRFGNVHGLSVLHYVHAPGYLRLFPGYTSQPPYDVLVAALESDAVSGGSPLNDGVPRAEMARATINSSPRDSDGKYQVNAKPDFWYGNRLQIYPVSPDADIPPPSIWSICTEYSVDGRMEWAAENDNWIDGIFLDNFTSTYATVENYDKELWAYSDVPLTFSWETGKVTLLDGFSMTEFLGSFRSYVHDRGLALMASSNSGMYAWIAPHLDIVGGEARGAEPLESAYVRRILGDGRPWSNLFVPPDGQPPDADEVLAYLRQALLFGYFPGFNGAYWNVPSVYERDREQFRRYVPLIRTVAQAGWEPVSGTTTGDPAVLVERFDSRRGGILYLTAQNTGTASKSVHFSLDAAVLAIGEGTVAVSELLRGKTLTASRSSGQISFSDTIPAGETFLYRIAAPRAEPDRGRTRSVGTRR
jgi:hypothetical protein